MGDVKPTKAFLRTEIEEAYQTITGQFKELRDTVRVFKRVTKEDTNSYAEQIEFIANGQLGRMIAAYKGIETGIDLLYKECDRVFYAVTPERRKALHQSGRGLKYLLFNVLERYKLAPEDGQQTLAAFWVDVGALTAYLAKYGVKLASLKAGVNVVDQIFEEMKVFEGKLRTFKVGVMHYVASAQFTTLIRTERLAEKWNIGKGDREGEDAVAEAEAQIADGNDDGTNGITNTIEYDADAKTLKKKDDKEHVALAMREAQEFINQKKRSRNGHVKGDDDDDDDEDDEDEDGDGNKLVTAASAEDLLVPERVSKRGGKNLRRRTRTQIELLKAQARGKSYDNDDDDDDGSNSASADNGGGGGGEDNEGIDDPSANDDSEGEADFKPENSDDSGVDSDDENDASHETSEEGKSDEDDDDDDNENDDGNDDDVEEESDEKPKPVKRRATASSSTATTSVKSAPVSIARHVDAADDDDDDNDDAEDTVSETKPNGITHAAPTTAPAQETDAFADIEF